MVVLLLWFTLTVIALPRFVSLWLFVLFYDSLMAIWPLGFPYTVFLNAVLIVCVPFPFGFGAGCGICLFVYSILFAKIPFNERPRHISYRSNLFYKGVSGFSLAYLHVSIKLSLSSRKYAEAQSSNFEGQLSRIIKTKWTKCENALHINRFIVN